MNFFQARVQISVFAATIAILAGCNNGADKAKLSVNDYFQADNEPRAVHNIFDAQSAIAAREDGTLYAHHFIGGALNSLGRQKLNAMSGGRELPKLQVYLDLPKDNDYAARQTAVMDFLTARGIKSDAMAINDGPNPNVGSPAAQGLAGLSKQSANNGAEGYAAGGSAGGAAPASGGASVSK